MEKIRNQILFRKAPIRLGSAMAALFFLSACSMADYGRLISSPEVTSTFKAYRIEEGYEYYYYGWLGEPDALLGLKKGITIRSDLWQKVDLSQISVQVLIDRVGRNPTKRTGYHVLDPQGNRIGIYFAGGGNATIRMAGATEIDWITPQIRKRDRMGGSND